MEAQGLVDSRIDPVGAIQKCGVQHHREEDNIDLLMALPICMKTVKQDSQRNESKG